MTKEELEKEAYKEAEKIKECQTEPNNEYEKGFNNGEVRGYKDGYRDGAEPREKQIEIDAKQIIALQKDKGELTDELKALRESIKDYGAGCYENGLRNGKKKLEEQIEKMKKYIKACWVEENLNDYSSYITNSSDEFRDLVKELNDEVRNGR